MIITKDLPFRKAHDLGMLLEVIQKQFPAFSVLRKDGDFLTGFYVEARYPDFPAFTVSKEIALRAREAAARIRNFVEPYVKSFLGPS